MSSNSDFSAAGSSTYSSDTLHVGDGTWDKGRDTFLLPNLMGVNFETMRYNGMGNRFRDMTGYHSMIVAHGVIATIVFLGLVPFSVLLIRYYSRWNPFWAFKLHVWCQVLTLLLTTVVFVLGWFAVGPERSLSNPHHGIGLAIYVLVIFQVLWGWLLHKIESKRKRYHVPLKLVAHRWIGRALAILGIIQIPLGLTLYGSPKSLFILFSLGAFALLAAWFVLSYLYDTQGHPMGSDYDSRDSYVSGPSGRDDHGHSNLGPMAAGGAAGVGLANFFRRRTRRDRFDDDHTSYLDEKYSEDDRHKNGWGKKLLELGAIVGAAALAKRFYDKRRDRNNDAESGRYSPAHRNDSMTEESLSRMEDGHRPEPTHRTPLNRPPTRPPSRSQSPGSSYYYNSTYLSGNEPGPSHKLRDGIFGAGALAALKNLFSRRRKEDDQDRIDELRRQEIEDERIARANSKRRYTGDGYYPRRRADSFTETDLASEMTRPPRRPSGSALSARPVTGGGLDGAHSEMPPSDLPPAASGHHLPSEMTGPDPSRHDTTDLAAGAAAGAAAGRSSSRRRRSHSNSRPGERVESPPVSVKLKMHNDGRHVTLRRLTEEEAAASREARRRERRSSRRRNGSVSSLSGNEGGYDRWRRVEELERQQAEQIQREQEAAAAANSTAPTGSVPPSSFVPTSQPSHYYAPPPARPPSNLPYGASSITSPGTGTFTGTDASGDYANNRRRRRAERARARQERQQHGVEFT